ncbi:MAG TPA: lysylphosphatidylglycerol synthase transmembrane domain-containing protein [Solirubrobacteraceae bacterium]|jgi:phosphatidylinositol alpha-mannosyltransferase|nr:lysylphosphatidylglycerol synthase transmembrane domain-containing protein [Solirubrobacteraceae bacterium]
MGETVSQPRPRRRPRWRPRRRVVLPVVLALLVGIVALALSQLGLHRVGNALTSAQPGWIALALVLMALSLLLRAGSWHEVLRAALPDTQVAWPPVIRATMIGVMGSAVFPGRIGEPAKMLVLIRRLPGSSRRQLPVVAGTVFSQTLINLLALAILATVTFTSLGILRQHVSGLAIALAVPLAICVLVLLGPRLLAVAQRSRSLRIALAAATLARLLRLGRQGLAVFANHRHGPPAVLLQLLAWTLQWLACYAVLLALGLQSDDGLTAAAAVLLAVNVSAVLPATPSNVGVFQAACLVVLAAYGVNAGPALAYGIILQAVEVLTALGLGIPALLGEGMTWRDIRGAATLEREETAESIPAERAPLS